MERKIGETFELEGTTLRVTEIKEHTCAGCFLIEECYREKRKVTGECFDRTDKKNVIFTEIKETPEKPEPQEEQKLNLLEILKYCPEGEKFWSPLLGDVRFICVGKTTIPVEDKNGHSWEINPDSTMTIDGITSAEPMLFPSREQRDWSKVHFETPVEKLPKSWQEFCETHEVQKGEAYIKDISTIYVAEKTGDTRDMHADKNILPSKQACRQHLALMQLHQLRDCWRDGWEPDRLTKTYAITHYTDGEIKVREYDVTNFFLSFQDNERAQKFLKCFRDLIERAGDLI